MTTDSLPLQGNKHIGSKAKHEYACTTMSEAAYFSISLTTLAQPMICFLPSCPRVSLWLAWMEGATHVITPLKDQGPNTEKLL